MVFRYVVDFVLLRKNSTPVLPENLNAGEMAIPLILAELKDMPNDWFWALRVLTDSDPVTPDMAGDMQAMADAWIAWGRDKRYI